jgi:leucyl-tRNA synthetase
VVLPKVERYQPTDSGESPLAAVPDWVNTTCPVCGGPAQRETDTMPNWAGSDWYFLRYCDPHNVHFLADMDKMRYWLPVDVYIGGDEHNTLHLLYSRFIYQFLHDIGLVPPEIPEPYRKRLSHGVILGPDGMRMSKSRRNVVNPDEYITKYGADCVRVYLFFIGPFDATMAWNEQSLLGVKRFLDRFEQFVMHHKDQGGKTSPRMAALVNKLGQQVADDIGAFKFNTAVAKCMKTLNGLVEDGGTLDRSGLADLVKILAPMAPFLAERCWEMLGMHESVHAQAWPEYNPTLEIDQQLVIAIQINGKLRATLEIEPDEAKEAVILKAKSLPTITRYLVDKEISREIYVPGRTLNFVVR